MEALKRFRLLRSCSSRNCECAFGIGLDRNTLNRDFHGVSEECGQFGVPVSDFGPDDISELVLAVSCDRDLARSSEEQEPQDDP